MKENSTLIVQEQVSFVVTRGGDQLGVSYACPSGTQLKVLTVYHSRGTVTGYRLRDIKAIDGNGDFNIDVNDPALQHCKEWMREEPVNNYLMLAPQQAEEVSAGGIYIPEQARNNAHQGTILKIGPRVSGEYQVGDQVVYTQHSEYKLKVDGAPIILVTEDNVILRIPEAGLAPSTTTAPETP